MQNKMLASTFYAQQVIQDKTMSTLLQLLANKIYMRWSSISHINSPSVSQ